MSQHDAAPQAGQPKKKCGGKVKLLLAVLVLAGAGYGAMKVTGWRPGLPQSSGAAPGVVPVAVLDKAFVATLQQLRSDLAQYRRDHRNNLPDFRSDNNPWHQMMNKTDASGVPGPAGEFGPYLKETPVNPLNGHSNVKLVDALPAPGTRVSSSGAGWVVDRKTGQIWGTTFKMEVDPR
jgi:hypothetical protein